MTWCLVKHSDNFTLLIYLEGMLIASFEEKQDFNFSRFHGAAGIVAIK
jgi:hypothetical protein